ncbi:MAG: hypothetical protein IPL36_13145 [Nigerium sp.]|nr:hypothetical protein [Nigerium sp.]
MRSGPAPPTLKFWIGGESHAANRIILTVAAIDLVRQIEGGQAPVVVEVVSYGAEGLPISTRLIPLIVFFALVMAGIFLPASSLVEEKEQGTLTALLVTPVPSRRGAARQMAAGCGARQYDGDGHPGIDRAVAGNWLAVLVVVFVISTFPR